MSDYQRFEHLIERALAVRAFAHAPYSKFKVGAALLANDGRIFTGCNVENISFGLTMCAERVCVGSALADSASVFEAIAIVSNSDEPVVPCGACRQVLAEFAKDLNIVSRTLGGRTEMFTLGTLLPWPSQGILR